MERARYVSPPEVGPDGQLASGLAQRIDRTRRTRGLDGQGEVLAVQPVPRDLLEGLDAQLFEAFAFLDDPVVEPPGQELGPSKRSQQLLGHSVGHRQPGQPGRAPKVVDVHPDPVVQPDRLTSGDDDAGARRVALPHGSAKTAQRVLIGAVGPQRAGHLGPDREVREPEQCGQPLLTVAQVHAFAVDEELPATEQTQACRSDSDGAVICHDGTSPEEVHTTVKVAGARNINSRASSSQPRG